MSDPSPGTPKVVEPAGPDAPADADAPVRRAWPGAAARIAVVVLASAVAYALVVPVRSIEQGRLDLLIPAANGTTDYRGKPAVQQKPASSAGLATFSADAKAHPHATGFVEGAWMRGQQGLSTVVFLTSSAKVAAAVEHQLVGQALGTGATQGLKRTATLSVPGVPGATGAAYSVTGQASKLALTFWTTGRAVGLAEVFTAGGAPTADAVTATRTAAMHLTGVLDGFTLSPTRYPGTTTAGWAGGTGVVAVAVGLGPVLRRRRRARRHQAWLDEQARLIKVRGGTVVRTRRG